MERLVDVCVSRPRARSEGVRAVSELTFAVRSKLGRFGQRMMPFFRLLCHKRCFTCLRFVWLGGYRRVQGLITPHQRSPSIVVVVVVVVVVCLFYARLKFEVPGSLGIFEPPGTPNVRRKHN